MDKQANQKSIESGGGIIRRLVHNQAAQDASFDEGNVPCNTPRRSMESRADPSFEGMPSSGNVNGGAFMSSGDYVRHHASILSLHPWIFRIANHLRDEEIGKVNSGYPEKCGNELDGFMYNSLPGRVSQGFLCVRGRSPLRTRRSHRHSIKPLSSMENCLIPQLYNEKFEIEEFVFSSLPSSNTPALRPFVVTDGSKIISKSSFGSMDVPSESGIEKGDTKDVMGVSPLPKSRTPKRKSRESPHEKLDSFNSQRSRRCSHPKDLLDGVQIFSIGVCLGIISSILSNKKEIEKLNDMLKSSENLVQDLQEELEMKESVTVKELSNEVCELQKPSFSIAEAESAESSKNQVSASYFATEQRDDHNLLHLPQEDSRSKIEAELEIELERLELNMKASCMSGRISELDELDPDLTANVVHGELKADMLPGGVSKNHADNASDSESTSTNHMQNVNYAVSPRELSLRLHEVIQHRLEERIKELERELQQTQKQLQSVESEHLLSQRAFSSSDMGSSSNQDSPMAMTGDGALSQPFCLNLAGDALDAYHEAYEEFRQVANTQEKLPSTTNSIDELPYVLHSPDRSLKWGMEGSKYCRREPMWEPNLKNRELNDAHEIHTINEDDCNDDEMKTLIDQILERTRQGSPIVLHAQRMLFSIDD